jgi:nucleotide-binding universal stress UspA family protein
MFEKVLFPTDFSVYSQKIFRDIGEIPGIKEIILLHIVDATDHSIIGVTHRQQIENARILLAEKKAFLETFDLKVQTIVKMIISARDEGSILTNILDTADRENVSLIIMGIRRKSLIQDLFLSSISSDVLREAKTNVLIMHSDPMECHAGTADQKSCSRIFSNVLVPTDFSQHASDALSFVESIKGIEKVILLHVVTNDDREEEIDNAVKESMGRLKNISKEIAGSGFVVTHHVRVGDPTDMILSVAEDDDVSLIAISPRGKNLFEDSVIGSTAFAVAHMARKPVLIIRENTTVQP